MLLKRPACDIEKESRAICPAVSVTAAGILLFDTSMNCQLPDRFSNIKTVPTETAGDA